MYKLALNMVILGIEIKKMSNLEVRDNNFRKLKRKLDMFRLMMVKEMSNLGMRVM